MATPVTVVLKVVEAMLGESARQVLEQLLMASREMTDEELAQALNMRVNDVRKVLYELARYGFVTYRRSRSSEGYWYTYYWRADVDGLARMLLHRKKLVLAKLRDRVEYEKNNVFYECPVDGARFSFDEAFENDFRCPRCGASLVEVDNSEFIRFLEELIQKLEREIEEDEKALSGRSV